MGAGKFSRRLRLGFGFAIAVIVTVGPATAAHAEVSPAGACTGTGVFTTGTKANGPFSVDGATVPAGKVIEVPKSDTVMWHGTVVGPAAGVERPISGFVAVDLPWPLGRATVDSWGGKSKRVENNGSKKYDLPDSVPRGVEFKVFGEHHENGKLFCSGSATVEVEGSAFDSAAAPVALALTAVSAVGLVLAGRAVKL